MRVLASWLLVAGLVCGVGITILSGRGQSTPLSQPGTGNTVTLSIVGTTDLHGAIFPTNGSGGLPLLAGFVNNLRAVRAADGGAVLLLDAGDAFLDGMESNLSEGAIVVDAYNAIGYTAAAIGNHEFDFGPVDAPGARQTPGDLRGAVKARAAQAHYPFLAANLVDVATDRPVEWPNVRPSVVVDAAGVRVGIIGVMTITALSVTAPVNVQGLHVAELAPTISAEASRLRAAGAEVIVVTAHAGGSCSRFDRPTDLSSCDPSSEIFALARSLPQGQVDVITAGHTHNAIAHQVNGVAIVQAYPRGTAFARADVVFDRDIRRVVRTDVFAPRHVCARQDPETLACDVTAPSASPMPVSRYEGRIVVPDARVSDAMAPALGRVRELQATPIGVVVETPIRRTADPESPLAHLLAHTLREALSADVALHSAWRGGLRADVPAGDLTFGRLYGAFPFDNRVSRIVLSGDELGRVLAEEIRQRRPLAIAGVVVRSSCTGERLDVELFRPNGRRVDPEERLVVVGMDSLVARLILTTSHPPPDVGALHTAPVLREIVEDWLRRRGGQLAPEHLIDPDRPRWEPPETALAGCVGL
jgi:2',3'-cyclic-nucleotide 2'-phosphodiesterase (5'-nucleotidase family)